MEANIKQDFPKLLPVRRAVDIKPVWFWCLTLGLILAGIFRSDLATRLDSFTLDEAYHITAGVSYAKTGSFRINPEHPPLTKLAVGAVVAANGFKLAPLRPMTDKHDERKFAEEELYLKNDPVAVQQQARMAMFLVNGLLLLLFTVLLRRTIGQLAALLTLTYLVIDPTLAAHLPVVMTDLPVALASGSAVLAAVIAFRTWRPSDLLLAAGCLGLALAAKHSAIITAVGVALTGLVMILLVRDSWKARGVNLLKMAAVMVGAIIVLWGFYGFRYRDSPQAGEFFNRPLATKIDDIQSAASKALLHTLADARLLPASYLWGLADTFRAGVEGRANSVFAFGKLSFTRAPFYYAPGIWAAKLPPGLIALTLCGLVLLCLRQLPRQTYPALAALGLLFCLFWLALATGSTYGGVRHALSLLPLFAALGGLAVTYALENGNLPLRVAVASLSLASLVEALPVVRPWEYFNWFAGRSENSYKYFNDEGVDLTQRSGELISYYNQHLKKTGEIPYIWYGMRRSEKQRYNIHWVGEDPEKDSSRYTSVWVTGTFFMPSTALSPNLYDKDDQMAVFRKANPVARMGNLLVFKGKFYLPNERAYWLGGKGFKALFIDSKPDTAKAIRYFSAAMKLYPKSPIMDWELGNLYLMRNARQEAIHAYELARTYSPDDGMKQVLTSHINKLKSGGDLRKIGPLRNPGLE